MHTADSNFLNFVIEYLGEIETEFENTLACLSGAQIGSNHEKNEGQKSRDTLPLREHSKSKYCKSRHRWNKYIHRGKSKCRRCCLVLFISSRSR